MRASTRQMNAALLAIVLALALPRAAHSEGDSPRVPVINWLPCPDFPEAQCATARVPLDYDNPDGPRTSIALARIPASNPSRRIGTLFVNPGGPGGSGVEMVLFGFGAFLEAQLDGRFDIVGFDPRGIGASEPLHCFSSAEQQFAFISSFEVFPWLRSQERRFFRIFSSLADRCFARGGRIVRHMSTADVARDLNLLRRAVGDARLNYLGFSYGSYIGNTYANLFPHKVRALVIDGVLNPRLWSSGRQIVSDRIATAEEFEEFLRLCDEAGCPLSGPDGAASRYWALVAAVREQPIVFDDGSLYTYDFLIADSVGAMYSPEVWPDFAAFFAFLADTVEGRQGAAANARALRASIIERLKPERADYPNGFDAYFGNQCSDTQYPHTLERFSAVGEFAEKGSVFGPLWWWGNTGCAHWPVAGDRYTGPWSTRTSRPVLVVGNHFDGVTDYRGAVATSRLLQNSRLLTYAGWGHTAYGRSECVTRHVDAYILRGRLPPKGTVCPANPNPFAITAAMRAAEQARPLVGRPPPTWPGWR
jgi:pimeloyl-ACP methyl ester carboxylesterase